LKETATEVNRIMSHLIAKSVFQPWKHVITPGKPFNVHRLIF